MINEQTGFIEGQEILDGILIAKEAINFVKKARKKTTILKVDFVKAFDSVSWGYLFSDGSDELWTEMAAMDQILSQISFYFSIGERQPDEGVQNGKGDVAGRPAFSISIFISC